MRAVRHRILVAALATAITVTAACSAAGQRSSAALGASEEVAFSATDGVRLAGRVFGDPEPPVSAGIVLAHMLPSDQSSWFDEAIRYEDAGYLVLTFNLRGYCPGGDAGCSEGEKAPEAAGVDLAAAVAYIRSLGVQRVGVVGASIGGTAALVVAASEGQGIDAVITLSAPAAVGGLLAGPDTVARITAAKLFLAGIGDGSAAATAEAFYNQSGQPKRYEILASDDHGTNMLTGSAAGRVRDLMDLWLETHLPMAP